MINYKIYCEISQTFRFRPVVSKVTHEINLYITRWQTKVLYTFSWFHTKKKRFKTAVMPPSLEWINFFYGATALSEASKSHN